MTYAEKKQQMIENARIRKENEIAQMNDRINKLVKNVSVINTTIELTVEEDNTIIDYALATYTNCYVLSVNYRKNFHPFDYYNHKEYYRVEDAPKKHRTHLQRLVDALTE